MLILELALKLAAREMRELQQLQHQGIHISMSVDESSQHAGHDAYGDSWATERSDHGVWHAAAARVSQKTHRDHPEIDDDRCVCCTVTGWTWPLRPPPDEARTIHGSAARSEVHDWLLTRTVLFWQDTDEGSPL